VGNWKIIHKLIIGMVIMIVIIGAMGLQAMYTIHNLNIKNSHVEEKLNEIYFLKEKEVQHLDWAAKLGDVFIHNKDFTGETDHTKCDFGQWYYSYIESDEFKSNNENYQKIFLDMDKPHRLLHQSAVKVKEYFSKGDLEQARNIYEMETYGYLTNVRNLISAAEMELRADIEKDLKELSAISRQSEVYNALGMTGGLLFGLIIAIVMLRSVIKPIKTIVERVKDIAQGGGDLTKRVDITTQDEIGILAGWINVFIENIHDIVVRITEAVQTLAASSEEIAASSEETSSSTQQISTSIHKVAQEAEKQNTSIIEASKALVQLSSLLQLAQNKARKVNASSDLTKANAQKGRNKVRETVITMDTISTKSQESAEVIRELNRLSARVGEIITTINAISDQTNLLALNAAIEAARAGEHGRGFSVVADEVRKLAEESAKGANEIAHLINQMAEQTEKAVLAMEEGQLTVSQGVQVVKETDLAFTEIIGAVEETVKNVKDIVELTMEEVATSDQIIGLIDSVSTFSENTAISSEEVASAAEEQTAATENVATGAEEISALASSLEELISRFRIKREGSFNN